MRGLSRYALIGLAATTVHYVLLVVLVEAAAAIRRAGRLRFMVRLPTWRRKGSSSTEARTSPR
jgi:hypothetical protein